MNNKSFKLAMGQMLVEGGEIERNLRRAVEMIQRAARQDCQIIVLPECLDLGWTHPTASTHAQPIPGSTSNVLSESARANKIYVVAGLTERDGDRVYNAAILVSPDGEILLKHRKINELAIAHDLYATGDRLAVAHTPLGLIGINICADNFPNSLAIGHVLARMGAQILLSPSAWAMPAEHCNEKEPYGAMWKQSYTTLAKLYEMPVIGVSNVGWLQAGPWQGQKCVGSSLAIGANGEVLAQADYGDAAEDLIVVPVEIKERDVRGTALTEALSTKGYEGP